MDCPKSRATCEQSGGYSTPVQQRSHGRQIRRRMDPLLRTRVLTSLQGVRDGVKLNRYMSLWDPVSAVFLNLRYSKSWMLGSCDSPFFTAL